MKIINLFTLLALFVIGVTAETQAQCTTSFTWQSTPNGVSFVATSTGLQSGAAYSWDFGDNSTGWGMYPSHTYNQAGTYIVCLTATDSLCTATFCDTVVVATGTGNSCAGFSAYSSSTVSGNTANFTSTVTGGTAPYSYSWAFGDGNSSTQANPAHTYANGGLYAPTLSVYDANGCSITYTDSLWISGGTGNPCANASVGFQYSPGAAGTIFNPYTNGLNTGGVSYSWTFPNGNTSNQSNPTAQLASGWHVVCVTATDSICTVSFCDSIYVQVGGNPCGNFYGSIASTNAGGGTVNFTSNFPIQQPFNYSWDFGDGNTSTQANPTHTYTQNGAYAVCMTADSAGCIVTYCDSVLVTGASNNNNGPCAGFNLNMNITQDQQDPFLLWMQPVLNNAPSNGQFTFVWDFGDNTGAISGLPSHSYSNFGSYTVCLLAIDTLNGCTATFCDTISIDSNGNFSRNTTAFLVNTMAPIINVTTSVETIEGDNFAMELFPNPARTELNLAITAKEAMEGTVSILDIAGKTVTNNVVNLNEGAQQVTLSVDHLPAGIYLVRMTSDAAQKTMKFIKE